MISYIGNFLVDLTKYRIFILFLGETVSEDTILNIIHDGIL